MNFNKCATGVNPNPSQACGLCPPHSALLPGCLSSSANGSSYSLAWGSTGKQRTWAAAASTGYQLCQAIWEPRRDWLPVAPLHDRSAAYHWEDMHMANRHSCPLASTDGTLVKYSWPWLGWIRGCTTHGYGGAGVSERAQQHCSSGKCKSSL